jgi:hypothetical protein
MESDILEQYYNENEILCVDLVVDGIRKQLPVHELVCRTFHGPAPTENSVATVIDRSKPLQADNIYWATPGCWGEDRMIANNSDGAPLSRSTQSEFLKLNIPTTKGA